MVVIGGLTRLTGSGLSMVEWAPILGWLPPMSDAGWQDAFQKYQHFPEYQLINRRMGLAEFQGIFWLEYIHRLVGRTIGLVFLLPFLWFLAKGQIARELAPRFVIMFVLGGLQGVMGWIMVLSGMEEDPHVQPIKLTAHLIFAFLLYAYILWTAWNLQYGQRPKPAAPIPGFGFARLVTVLITLTAASGGFVAGLKAGGAYNTFPLMGERWIPEAYGQFEPFLRNFVENPATVQWNHRLLAILTLCLVVALWAALKNLPLARRTRWGANLMFGWVWVQVGLGVMTLLLFVPIALASMHQAGALVLLTLALYVVHGLRHAHPSMDPKIWTV
ncbi:MAG: COX15/CtaA family protein [Magnetococcales bacterium]|nr:COX15/CtaA family protein [Magnetococcales bacterium]